MKNKIWADEKFYHRFPELSILLQEFLYNNTPDYLLGGVLLMGQERRQTERIQPILRVRTEVFSSKANIHLAIFADILNISEEGICIQSPLELEISDRLKVYLPRLDQDQPLIIQGEVIWREEISPYVFKCGLALIEPDRERKEELKADIKTIMETYFQQKPWELK